MSQPTEQDWEIANYIAARACTSTDTAFTFAEAKEAIAKARAAAFAEGQESMREAGRKLVAYNDKHFNSARQAQKEVERLQSVVAQARTEGAEAMRQAAVQLCKQRIQRALAAAENPGEVGKLALAAVGAIEGVMEAITSLPKGKEITP